MFVAGAAVGAGALYALGEDSIESYFESSLAETHAAALAHFTAHGEVETDRPGSRESRIRAVVEGVRFDLQLTAVTTGPTRVVVQAPKWATLAPDLVAAREFADQLAHHLE